MPKWLFGKPIELVKAPDRRQLIKVFNHETKPWYLRSGDEFRVYYTLTATEEGLKFEAFSFYDKYIGSYNCTFACKLVETGIWFDPDKPWDDAFSAVVLVCIGDKLYEKPCVYMRK